MRAVTRWIIPKYTAGAKFGGLVGSRTPTMLRELRLACQYKSTLGHSMLNRFSIVIQLGTETSKTIEGSIAMRDDIRERLRNEFVTVTDIPTNAFGVYNYGPGDDQALRDYQGAAAGLLNAQQNRLYWDRLARSVFLHRVARCHGCTAFAARCLTELAAQHNMRLFIAGVPDFDHHIVFVTDVTDVNAVIAGQPINDATQFPYQNSIVVDLWQYNIHRQQTGRLDLGILAEYTQAHMYTSNHNVVQIYVQY
jgi:hypothetical protein